MDDIIAGARNPESVADLGVRTVHLDYTDQASIEAALVGVDFVLLISSSEIGQRAVQHANVIAAAATAGVKQLVYTSAGDGRVSSASRTDYAEAASEVLGTPVVAHHASPEEHAAALAGFGLDDGTVGFVVGLDGNIRDGLLGVTTGDLARLIGRPTTPLIEGLAAGLVATRA